MSSPIQLNFIRNSSDGGIRDDILAIRQTESSKLFRVDYSDLTGSTRNRMLATEQEVLDFMDCMFTLIPIDEDPFNSVQVTCPGFPAILLDVADVGKDTIQNSIWCLVKNTLRNWPVSVKPSTKKLRSSNPLTA